MTIKKNQSSSLDEAWGRATALLRYDYGISKRFLALLLLQEDEEIMQMVRDKEPAVLANVQKIVEELKAKSAMPVEYELALQYRNRAVCMVQAAVRSRESRNQPMTALDAALMRPVTGVPILLLVLYLGLYQFVGVFGAGVVVNFVEGTVFERFLNPWMTSIIHAVIPWPVLQDLFVGEYGVLTLGFRYAVALILPIVTFFFIVFSMIEDSGYLPRLAMLLDRVFKKIGLSGRAVIPMVLGFGCDTMATMVTRTLPTQRERLITTFLLTLAVPCSAQLGVILALLSHHPAALAIWGGVILLVFLSIGMLIARILPGRKPSFYMELPPLRWPHVRNIANKTYVRVRWYFVEILPIFIGISVLIWIGRLTGVFDVLVRWMTHPVEMMGLPPQTASSFLFGFFRRDYGAAGLYDLNKAGLLSGQQLLVASVALTLFLPCIAQFVMNIKERGWKVGVLMSVFVFFFAFAVALALNAVLNRMAIIL